LVGEEERKKVAGYFPVAQYLLNLITAGYKTVERLVTQEIAEVSIKL
jgi:hypothetical protein